MEAVVVHPRRRVVPGHGPHEGNPDDLAQIVRVAQAWHEGSALAEVSQAASFVHPTGRFEVPDNDPAQLAESEWQHLRIRAAEADWPEFRALIEAAYSEPALRALYPFTSHWTLRFSTSTRPQLSTDIRLLLDAHRGGRYTISDSLVDGTILAETGTAEELASLAAALSSYRPGTSHRERVNLRRIRLSGAEPRTPT